MVALIPKPELQEGNHHSINKQKLSVMKKLSITLTALLAGLPLLAQEPALVTDIIATPNYFIVILTGVIIAAGIQFLLTALSVAIGISAVPNVKEAYVENRYGIKSAEQSDEAQYESGHSSTGVMISSALGLWNMVTVALSLFCATALALHLSAVVTPTIALVLSLCIWSLFFLLVVYLEGRAISTAVGGLIHAAVAGLRAAGETVQTMFAPSPAKQVEQVADHTVEKIREEIRHHFDPHAVNEVVDSWLDRVADSTPSYETLKRDLQEIVRESAGSDGNGTATWMAIQQVADKLIGKSSGNGRNGSVKQKIQQLITQLSSESSPGGASKQTTNERYDYPTGYTSQRPRRAAQPQNAQSDGNGIDTEQVQALGKDYADRLKNWLLRLTPERMDEKRLEAELRELFDDPSGKLSEWQEQAGHIDRDMLIETISKNTALDRAQVEQYADRIEQLIDRVRHQLPGANDTDRPLSRQLLERIESRIERFINASDDPRLNYDLLRADLSRAFDNPGESLNIIQRRLDTFDRDTLISVLTNNRRIDRADINRIADQVEQAREEVLSRIQQAEDKVRSTYRNLERRAVIQAEHARKTAVTAAWWTVATILVSAAAAVAGGALAV